jgi:periplasmic protein TonB
MPAISEEALAEKAKGLVVLTAVITRDGRATEIRVLLSRPDGLNEVAVECVQSWKFKPATDIDGKSIPIHQVLGVIFKHR